MPAPKGRPQRQQDGEYPMFVRVGADVIARLDAGAKEMNMTRAAYIERLVRAMPVDERGLPPWLAELVDAAQLPIGAGEERTAA